MRNKIFILILGLSSYGLGSFVEFNEDSHNNGLNLQENERMSRYQKKLSEIRKKTEAANEKIATAEFQLKKFKDLITKSKTSTTSTTDN